MLSEETAVILFDSAWSNCRSLCELEPSTILSLGSSLHRFRWPLHVSSHVTAYRCHRCCRLRQINRCRYLKRTQGITIITHRALISHQVFNRCVWWCKFVNNRLINRCYSLYFTQDQIYFRRYYLIIDMYVKYLFFSSFHVYYIYCKKWNIKIRMMLR